MNRRTLNSALKPPLRYLTAVTRAQTIARSWVSWLNFVSYNRKKPSVRIYHPHTDNISWCPFPGIFRQKDLTSIQLLPHVLSQYDCYKPKAVGRLQMNSKKQLKAFLFICIQGFYSQSLAWMWMTAAGGACQNMTKDLVMFSRKQLYIHSDM